MDAGYRFVIYFYNNLVSFAVAKPTASCLDIVEGEVKTLPHPIPVCSHLHQACPEGQTSSLPAPLGVCGVERAAIMSADWPLANEEMSHTPCNDFHDVIKSVV